MRRSIDTANISREQWKNRTALTKFARQNAKQVMGSDFLVSPWTTVTGYEESFGLWALPIGGAILVMLGGVIKPNGGGPIFLQDIPIEYRPSHKIAFPVARTLSSTTELTMIEVMPDGEIAQTNNFSSSETHLFLSGSFWFAQT